MADDWYMTDGMHQLNDLRRGAEKSLARTGVGQVIHVHKLGQPCVLWHNAGCELQHKHDDKCGGVRMTGCEHITKAPEGWAGGKIV